MIYVLDYGLGNLRSVVKAFELYTDNVVLTDDPSCIKKADAVVLPGDGAFGKAMENLTNGGFVGPLLEFINNGRPLMGICVGFQILFDSSVEFGFHKGLGVVPGKIVKFNEVNKKVPHMGWNDVTFTKQGKYLVDIPQNSYFYFIHTYYPVIEDESYSAGICAYQDESFTCIIEKDNLVGTQFHPEKSHKWGLKIVENFVKKVK